VYILAWNYSWIYALEWEWSLESKFQGPQGRMQFRFDNEHAVGGSHHQKFAVIDNSVAFVGGFDFNSDDWDDRDHLPEKPDRGDHGRHHGPYHDIQACLVGPAALELGKYFKSRWERAGNNGLELYPPLPLETVEIGVPVRARKVALSLNQPKTINHPESTLEIRVLYEDAIRSAREMIYMENQYFSAEVVGNALLERMRDRSLPQLDIAVVLPKQLPSWVEAAAMEPGRLHWIKELNAAAQEFGHHLGFYYTTGVKEDGTEVPTLIHSKLMVIDDCFLTVGSANASNRSQGLDTELNVSWEARDPDEDALRASIRNVRVNLLSEHCGLLGTETPPALLRRRGLVDYLDFLAQTRSGRLRTLTPEAILEERGWLNQLDRLGVNLDPTHSPIDEVLS
jgi:phospholipase D1/2